ncbi:hypothetical protein JCM10212_000912 [Sporobolomyces blumeae]
MFRLSLIAATALLSIDAVYASVISTSVFPNSACAGSTSLGGLVGIGRVTLANGEVETHCGCPSDNLPDFSPCDISAHGESVCNSVLNLDTGSFTASDCPSTVVNSVVVDNDDCYNNDKGSIGIVSIDGEVKCGCSSDAAGADFTACPAPANGRATCVSVDSDFLGMAYTHKENTDCGVVCDEGYFLTPGGSCTKLEKRAHIGSSAGPSHTRTGGPSGSPTTVPHHPHNAHTTTYPNGTPVATTTTTSYSYKHHQPSHGPGHHGNGGHPTPSSRPPFHDRTTTPGSGHHPSSRGPIKAGPSAGPSSGPHGSHSPHHGHGSHSGPHGGSSSPYHHHHHSGSAVPTGAPHHPSSRPTWEDRSSTHSPSASHTSWGGPGKVGPSQVARRAAEEFVFSDLCAQDERTCPTGSFGDFTCVRLDDVTECGGCNSTNDAKNCLEIVGASSVACLRGGCVVRSCQTGYIQTSEGSCERVD